MAGLNLPFDKTLKYTKLSDIRPYAKNVNTILIILEKLAVSRTKEGALLSHCWAADSSASVKIGIWDTDAEWLKPGDIFCLKGGNASFYKEELILYVGSKYGTMERIGEFTMLFTEVPNMSEAKWIVDPSPKAQEEKKNKEMLVPVFPKSF